VHAVLPARFADSTVAARDAGDEHNALEGTRRLEPPSAWVVQQLLAGVADDVLRNVDDDFISKNKAGMEITTR
jgi:hypothetical protein